MLRGKRPSITLSSALTLTAVFVVAALFAPRLHNQGRTLSPQRGWLSADSVSADQGLPARELEPVKQRSQVRGDGLPPRAPNPWFFVERAYPLGEIPRERWRVAQAQAAALRAAGSLVSVNWTPPLATRVGTARSFVVPSPILPFAFWPQQYASPANATPHVKLFPAEMERNVKAVETRTGAFSLEFVLPSPSSPEKPAPQQ